MDRRLRELERRAQSGGVEEGAALLVARVRGGHLERSMLQLAAFLGDDIATKAAGEFGIKPSKHTGRWVRRLAGFHPRVADYMVLITHQAYTGLELDIPPRPNNRNSWWRGRWDHVPDHFRVVVQTAKVWWEDPEDERAQMVIDLAQHYENWRAVEVLDFWRPNQLPICYLGDMVRGRSAEVVEASFKQAVRWRSPTYSKWGRNHVERALREKLAEELVPWALAGAGQGL